MAKDVTGGNAGDSADECLLFLGGTILTMDEQCPTAEALLVRRDRIAAVGSLPDVLPLAPPGTRSVTLDGKTLLPGFIDSHAHLCAAGSARTMVDLSDDLDAAQLGERLRHRAASLEPGAWILGWGWREGAVARILAQQPNLLDDACPGHPIYLSHADGHAAWVNREAIRRTGPPPVSDVARLNPHVHTLDRGGPLGILGHTEATWVRSRIPPPNERTLAKDLQVALASFHAAGVTAVHDACTERHEWELFERLARRGELPLRVHALLSTQDEAWVEDWLRRGPSLEDDFLTTCTFKLFLDGTLGSRGAALSSPYHDAPETCGTLLVPTDRLVSFGRRAAASGFRLALHAIGDQAVRAALEAFRELASSDTSFSRRRHRIEHLQFARLDDLPSLAALGVLAAMQTSHHASDLDMYPERLGPERAAHGAYAWRSVVRSGMVLCDGSDAPIEPIGPLRGLYAAVTRCGWDGRAGSSTSEESLSRWEALASATRHGAFAALQEERRGRLARGFDADLVVLSQNPLACSEEDLLNIRVLETYVAGRIVYRATD